MGGELWCGQAQNGVNLEFQVKLDLEGQGRSVHKTIGTLTNVFCILCPNLVVLAWTGPELSRGQASYWQTDRHRHTDAGNNNTRRPKLVSGNKTACHYSDVIMSAMASQITIVSHFCSAVCPGADQRKHQSSASLAFVWGIHRWPEDSPHNGTATRKIFSIRWRHHVYFMRHTGRYPWPSARRWTPVRPITRHRADSFCRGCITQSNLLVTRYFLHEILIKALNGVSYVSSYSELFW